MNTGVVAAWNAARLAFTEPTTLFDRLSTGAELRRLGRELRPGQGEGVSVKDVDRSWRQTLHRMLATETPCAAEEEFRTLWSRIKSSVAKRDERIGEVFDADQNLGLATWCAVRHLKPTVVVETGVARGITSWIILEALAQNRHGHLWSIDLPRLAWAYDAGRSVPAELRERWTLRRGASKRRLPALLQERGPVDLFISDSLHTEDNVRLELHTAWPALRDGGIIVVDDVDDRQAYGSGRAFTSFAESRPEAHWFVARQEAKPGCFGVIGRVRTVTTGVA